MTPVPTAFCDANVLYSALPRDLLIRLALAELCEVRWSDEVQDEWTRNLLAMRPDRAQALTRTRALMERALPQARCHGYESLIPGLALPDPDDRHVLAAALHSGADVLLTFNLKDFPPANVPGGELLVTHPDSWLVDVMVQDEELTLTVVQELLAALRSPRLQVADLAEALDRLTLTRTAEIIRTLGR
ncbi:PIN domain-containing protein [Deinococcus marmoris]|uniref:Uncharacterized protein n=1 Tax=Deinococcus marmoris TaxID=249408 RepID=A0A1U7NWP2_9DEIO|nr:PIN domain-containing protein [Deinococcus marmoris]OLV17326.1 hypothetical protein BOO71_0009190 [Deinococcus marmoris]